MIDKNLPVLPLKDVYYDQQRVALDQSDNLPRSRVHSKIGTISKYHENCHSEYADPTLETKIDHRIMRNIAEMKRIILSVRLSQTPLELNYNGRITASKLSESGYAAAVGYQKTSKIPRPVWIPVSTYKSKSEVDFDSRGKQSRQIGIASSEIYGKKCNRKGPFVKSLIPDITPLSYRPEITESPFRSRFIAQYERGYNEITTKRRKPHVWIT